MKALIIGGGGFVGRYLAEHLLQDCGWETIVTKLPKETVEVEGCEAYNLDILDKDAVEALLVRHKPDAILHLAAQSSVAYSWKNPQLTADINIHGCLNVLDAVRDIPDYSPKILLIGSGEEYGILPANTSLVSETTPVHPANPYAITKMAQNLFGALYAKAYEMHVMMVREGDHRGGRPCQAASGGSAGDPCRYFQATGRHRLAAGDPAGTDHCGNTGILETAYLRECGIKLA